MFSLNGNVFSGRSTLGVGSVVGLWEELTGSSNTSNFTECPAGFTYNYNPSTNSGSCVPEAGGVTVKIDGQAVNPYTKTNSDCPVGFTYVERADGTGSCVAAANVTTENKTWGTTTYAKGGDSYNPAGSTTCPKGTTWDPVKGQCGKGTCPAGTVLDSVNRTCNKVVSGGGTVPVSKPSVGPVTPPPPEPPVSQSGLSPMAIAAVVLGVGALGAIIYKVRKDHKNKMTSNEYDEEEC